MIGIYQDNFLNYLKENLGDNIKVTSKNIVAPCCWCEYQKVKNHYHLYIALDAPIFHCFHAGCEQGGTLKKLLRKIEGHDISDAFIDRAQVKEYTKKKAVFVDKETGKQTVRIPQLNPILFAAKEFYIRKRLKFASFPSNKIKGLVYDINQFIELNKIPINETLFRIRDYLHANFIGFLTENNTTLMLRNIDHTSHFKFFKMKISYSNFIDYYKLPGNSNSNKVVLAEGIFDIFTTYLFDSLNLNQDVRLYASVLSSKYQSLVHSLVYHEQIFRPDIIILSDRGIDKSEYSKLKKYNNHIINTLNVFYNKSGKDFNCTPVTPIKFVI